MIISQTQAYDLPWHWGSVAPEWVTSTFWRCVSSEPSADSVLSSGNCSRTPLTCYEADGGTVTTAQFWVSPGHHGHSEVVVPRWQQISYSLKKARRQKTNRENHIFFLNRITSLWPWKELINNFYFIFCALSYSQNFPLKAHITTFFWDEVRCK